MDPVIKAEWIDDLTSGRYLQGKGRLQSVDEFGVKRYCCLGVLMEQAVRKGIVPPSKVGEPGIRHYPSVDDNGEAYHESAVLTGAVMRWAGLSSDNPDAEGSTLATLNDGGVTFENIAAIIEENF